MAITEILQQYAYKYMELIVNFFSWYNEIGRKILDFLYFIFDKAFNALLLIAFLVSFLYLIMSIYVL